ncbi:MAG: hypothetical protein COA66_10295 [Arcobacter sp.]|nr:MAG: hypothetical protein COA66_10295 [Arcobacter sp.]
MNSNVDLAIEQSLLSSIIFDNNLMDDLLQIISNEDFYIPQHNKIFKVMTELYYRDEPIDEDFLRKRLSSDEVTDITILDILSKTPITNPNIYAKELKESSISRKLYSFSNDIKKIIEEDKSIEEKTEEIENMLFEITFEKDGNNKTLLESNDVVNDVLKKIEEAKDNNGPIGQKTDIIALDSIYGAIQAGLIIIAARTSAGKTAFLTTLVTNFIKKQNRSLVVTLEMSSNQIMERILAALSGETLDNIQYGKIQNLEKFEEACRVIKNSHIIFDEKTRPTMKQLSKRIRKVLSKNTDIKDVFIDHSDHIKINPNNRIDVEIGEITKECKAISREFEVRVYLLHQLNRELEKRTDKRPVLSDLKNSGNVEQDADLILFLHNDYYHNSNNSDIPDEINAEIKVGKNRIGNVGIAKVRFDRTRSYFKDAEVGVWKKK